MLPDAATKRPRGRPFGSRNRPRPTTADKMADALRIWRLDLDRPDAVRGVLCAAGFPAIEIAALADIAVAAARKRHPGRR
jgi:hypothetical protein